jgi:16S rRNA (adenine1518-N6/adenine1519-N6)-dimethyltransferase
MRASASASTFLLDLNLTRRIARAAAPLDHGTTIEIGPGPGGLTRALLLEGAARGSPSKSTRAPWAPWPNCRAPRRAASR